MGRFNLLHQPWIRVMKNSKGETEEVSIIELFRNSPKYIDLAGDTATQDYAVFRVLLAILHTVYSRYDYEGETYTLIEIDDMMRQIEDLDDDIEEYNDKLFETWEDLWENKEFSQILYKYLDNWEDRFYLFDEEYPFFQVKESDVDPKKISRAKPGGIRGKTINRLVSESGNKVALFSPKTDKGKDVLTESEVARWLITFQGYTSLSDKVIFGNDSYKSSKGWLFDLGGIYLKGDSLYENLILNLVILHSQEDYFGKVQKPCWEYDSSEWINRHFEISNPDNLAELYTRWGRAIYVEPNIDISKPFSMGVIKLPEINHIDNFLEPMTVWRFNNSGDNKGRYTPRKHPPQQSMWRSFGLITMPYSLTIEGENNQKPEIITWLGKTKEVIGDYDLRIQSVSMRDDGNATSWMPIDEILDSLRINDAVLVDDDKEGWIIRITETVDFTKSIIDKTYRIFLNDLRDIRNLESGHQFVPQNIEAMYYMIDQPFKEWLASIRPEHTKAEKISEWKKSLKLMVLEKSERHLENAGRREYLGIEKDGKQLNIVTAHNKFKYFLNKEG